MEDIDDDVFLPTFRRTADDPPPYTTTLDDDIDVEGRKIRSMAGAVKLNDATTKRDCLNIVKKIVNEKTYVKIFIK